MIKKDQESKQEVTTETYLKKKKTKREREHGESKYHNMSKEMKQN